MDKSFKDLIRLLLPLNKEKKIQLQLIQHHFSEEDLKFIKQLLKLKKIGISHQHFNINNKFAKNQTYIQFNRGTEESGIATSMHSWNNKLKKEALENVFEEFSKKADKYLPKLIAPHIIGFEEPKLTATWQLFSPERFHILLLGDPGTGKTEILRAAAQLSPISSFGLGSGTSGAGLSAAKKGKELVKGLLPLAHQGVCCIDELNLMKSRDRGALLNAMEKGFVTYDKGSTHEQLPAEARILATANPKGDRFVGSNIEFLKEQLPFDPALISRFHLVFFIRRPDKAEFLKITKNIITKKQEKITVEDVNFIRSYVKHANNLKVEFNKNLEPVITDFFDDLKSNEEDYLIELSPRLVLGVVRMAKAKARMSLRDKVTQQDLTEVLQTFKKSLVIPPDEISKKRKRQ